MSRSSCFLLAVAVGFVCSAGLIPRVSEEASTGIPVAKDLRVWDDAQSEGPQTLVGDIVWPGLVEHRQHRSRYFIQRQVVPRSTAAEVVHDLANRPFPKDLDSVDNAATYQFWLYAHNRPAPKDPVTLQVRAKLDIILRDTVLPFIQRTYAADGDASASTLVPCFSFIRRYKATERTKHPTHFDFQSHTTFVVSLNGFGTDYVGGLYVATGDRLDQRQYVDLAAGDGVVHQSDLLHGVNVTAGERWSWVVWFRPGQCTTPSTTWHANLARDGDPVHQFLLARRLQESSTNAGQIDQAHPARSEALSWLRKSAEAGFARAQNDLGEMLRESSATAAAAGQEETASEGRRWLEAAAARGEPSAHHNLGLLHLSLGDEAEAVKCFDRGCAGGSPDACFNLAVAYNRGKGRVAADPARAVEILRTADTPDAAYFAYQITNDASDLERAATLGHADAQFELASELLRAGASEAALEHLRAAAVHGHHAQARALLQQALRNVQRNKDDL